MVWGYSITAYIKIINNKTAWHIVFNIECLTLYIIIWMRLPLMHSILSNWHQKFTLSYDYHYNATWYAIQYVAFSCAVFCDRIVPMNSKLTIKSTISLLTQVFQRSIREFQDSEKWWIYLIIITNIAFWTIKLTGKH